MSEGLLNRYASRASRHDGHAVMLGAADWLHLAAAPAFAVMALLTGFLDGGSPDMLCSGSRASPLGGMVAMYVLMSVFHVTPWFRLMSRRKGDDVP
ncbi:MAG: hypothetical protein CFE29_27400 [Bradyrhizobiaceae bacterium PARB1]|jgi:hypothetical protein|nr:MAG: hypothetical protein CFE29_27400 [Bradyrhizobiaceae bacterium PARB1]